MKSTMKAIICSKYGSPDELMLKEVPIPSPGDDEILIKIHATSINAGDWHLMRADPFLVRLMFGLFKPKHEILGTDVAGVIEATGKNVKKFKVGDEVFGDLSVSTFGGFAEYVTTTITAIAMKPASVSFEEAAAVPSAAVTALQGLRDHGNIRKGDRVIINGASGGVGSFAVQIAKTYDTEVTAVCSSRKLDMVKSLDADFIIDYTKEDFTQNGQQYDLILAANGYHPIAHYSRVLSSGGRYVNSGGTMKQLYDTIFKGPFMSGKRGKKFTNFVNKPNHTDLEFLAELLTTGKVKPVIDRIYSLPEVPKAIRYLEEGRAAGKVVITMV